MVTKTMRTFEIKLADGDVLRKHSSFEYTYVVAYIDGPEWQRIWLKRLRSCITTLPGQDEWNASYNRRIEAETKRIPVPGAPYDVAGGCAGWYKTRRGAERAAAQLRATASGNDIMAFVGVFPCTEV